MIPDHGDQHEHQLTSTDKLAQLLDVSPRTIRAWAKEGRLPYYAVSPGCVRFKISDVMEAIEKRKVNTRH